MSNDGVSDQEFGLSLIESNQLIKHSSSTPIEVDLANYFRTYPGIRQQVLMEPFSKRTLKDLHGVTSKYEYLRGAIISDTEGQYDIDFAKLPRNQQRERLYEQIDSSADITIRIQKYVEMSLSKIDKMSDAELYRELCKVAFGTENEDLIKSKYALSQRRGFKLSIVNFLQTREMMKPYATELTNNPQEFAKKYLGKEIKGPITFEKLPIGLVLYIDEDDYALVRTGSKTVQTIKSDGCVLYEDYLPLELWGRLVLISRGGEVGGHKTEENIEATRRHEIRHVLFHEFHELFDTNERQLTCNTIEDEKRFSELMLTKYLEEAKDEIIAYFSHGGDTDFEGLRFYQYIIAMRENLMRIRDSDKRKMVLDIYEADRIRCFNMVKNIVIVAKRMYTSSWLDHDKAEALLRNTPGAKIHRLARYTELSEDDIRSGRLVKEAGEKAIEDLEDIATRYSRKKEKLTDEDLNMVNDIKEQLPIELFPKLLGILNDFDEEQWESGLQNTLILLLGYFIKIHGVPREHREQFIEVVRRLREK